MDLKTFLGRRKRRRILDRARFASVIGVGSTYRGPLHGDGDYVIHGSVVGDCDVGGVLLLARGGHWNGTIRARDVVIAGEVVGNIAAAGRVELRSSARIRGNIEGPVIAIAEGAQHEGEIRMRPIPRVHTYVEQRADDGVQNPDGVEA